MITLYYLSLFNYLFFYFLAFPRSKKKHYFFRSLVIFQFITFFFQYQHQNMNIHTVKLLWWTIVVLLLLRNLDFKTLYLHKCEIKSVRKVALGVLWACPLCKKGQNCCYATVYQHKHWFFTLLFYQIEPLKNGANPILPFNLSRDL